jgi:transcriptional regulator
MYVPAHFAEDRIPVLHEAIRGFGLATLVTNTSSGLIASHLPILLSPEPAPHGTLIGHLARPNPQTRDVIGEALMIFQGTDGYMTPSYYATKRETGKVVPTWNYISIHAYGTLRFIDDPARKLEIVTDLTNLHEGKRAAPWAVSDAPADFVQGMLNGIVRPPSMPGSSPACAKMAGPIWRAKWPRLPCPPRERHNPGRLAGNASNSDGFNFQRRFEHRSGPRARLG